MRARLARLRYKFAEFSTFTSHKQLNILRGTENEWHGKETEPGDATRGGPSAVSIDRRSDGRTDGRIDNLSAEQTPLWLPRSLGRRTDKRTTGEMHTTQRGANAVCKKSAAMARHGTAVKLMNDHARTRRRRRKRERLRARARPLIRGSK